MKIKSRGKFKVKHKSISGRTGSAYSKILKSRIINIKKYPRLLDFT